MNRLLILCLLIATGSADAQTRRSSQSSLQYRQSRASLPKSVRQKETPAPIRDLRAVKPPRSGSFYGSGGKEAEYEKLIDQEADGLYKLSLQFRRSRSRGEIWLRLAERYVEKARLVEYREQQKYDERLKAFMDKKTTVRPRIDLRLSREYNQKAIELYEWFVRDFSSDKKMDQALFFLGYNNFELGEEKKGELYYARLLRDYPDSLFVPESYFALGEYYFDKDQWQKALENYNRVALYKSPRLMTFALYKAAWCLYRLSRTLTALKALDRVVQLSRAGSDAAESPERRSINRVRLATEALKDYVPFYAEGGDYRQARNEFERITQDTNFARKMLERLAYTYLDIGNRPAAIYVFKELISANPTTEKAADFQYRVVMAYAVADPKNLRGEMDYWILNFGPNSAWANANASNEKLLRENFELQESTLRNYVLQMHQTAQNTRAAFSQKLASVGYGQYHKYFSDSPRSTEMLYFNAELFFDMNRHADAARTYYAVYERDPKGEYADKAILNALLALEKGLPSQQEMENKRGKSVAPMQLDPPVKEFERVGMKYVSLYPKSETRYDILRRIGVIYYSYNHFDEANAIFEQIIRERPKSDNAEIAGNLILDSYKLRGDMAGFVTKGQEFLANPQLSKTKFGAQVRSSMEGALFLKAEKSSESKDFANSAKEFETFSNQYRNSKLIVPARYKAAIAYEKSGDLASAIRMHLLVLGTVSNDKKAATAQQDSRNELAKLYQAIGQFTLSAKYYEAFAANESRTPNGANAFFNAAILREALGEDRQAMQNYDNYFRANKKFERVETFFRQAEMQFRRGKWKTASDLYEVYLQNNPRNSEHVVLSNYRIAQCYQERGKADMANRYYRATVDTYKARRSPEAVRWAAESLFQLSQPLLAELRSIRFTSSDQQQAKAAVRIKDLRERYISEMKPVIKMDYGPMIIAALASTGQMFETIADLFGRVPTPAGFAPEDAKKYRELIQAQVQEVTGQAKSYYKSAHTRALELEVYDLWTRRAYLALQRLDPAAVPVVNEIFPEPTELDRMGL